MRFFKNTARAGCWCCNTIFTKRVQYASGDSSSENSALTLICFLRFHLWWLNHLFHLQQLVQKARRGHGVKSVSESLKHKLNHLLTLLLTVIWYGIYDYFFNMRNHSWCTVCIKVRFCWLIAVTHGEAVRCHKGFFPATCLSYVASLCKYWVCQCSVGFGSVGYITELTRFILMCIM